MRGSLSPKVAGRPFVVEDLDLKEHRFGDPQTACKFARRQIIQGGYLGNEWQIRDLRNGDLYSVTLREVVLLPKP